MAVFKCKMCGGDLEITEGVSVAECEYCGSKQTLPNADNEKKMTLFGRANRLRLANEFDKAAGIYESIAAEFPEEAEAYWGLVLCKYGIEYVDDPATGKKIPTCHRSSFESIMDDANFEQAQENADPMARRVYRDEAKAIEEIRKKIIEISGKEEPYDLFICYKETAEDGGRTIDSVLAQDIYTELTEKGYRVFFSRISLEDKLGAEYEPYIFAALHSAKVMLAVGTDFEYYNAVWVKNEWSRFLQMIASGEKKVLIPCFKGLDAYDMPKEFAHLQAQDMGKVGAMQDLVRGINKIFGRDRTSAVPAQQAVVVQQSGGPSVDSLLRRGFLYLEDSDWAQGEQYFQKVLDIDPENAQGYLGLAMARHRAMTKEAFGAAYIQGKVPEQDQSLARVRQFGTAELTEWINGLEEQKKQNEGNRQQNILAIAEKRKQLAVVSKMIATGGSKTVCLNLDGTVLAVGNNEGGQCDVNNLRDIVTVAVSGNHTVVLKSDGTVMAAGHNGCHQCDVGNWSDIVAVAAGSFHTVGLKSDGTVVAVGCNDQDSCRVTGWHDVVAIESAGYFTVGLKSDGTVLVAGRAIEDGETINVKDWRNIVAVACNSHTVIGLRADGTVVARDTCDEDLDDVRDWSDIISVAAGDNHVLGLKIDGTVAVAGESDADWSDVMHWQDIVAIDGGEYHTVGIKADGTVVAVGDNEYGQCNVQGWKLFDRFDKIEQQRENAAKHRDMLKKKCEQLRPVSRLFSAGFYHTVGLKADGTVLTAGPKQYAFCVLDGWHDILEVSSGRYHTIGLKSDGTIAVEGSGIAGQWNTGGWQDMIAVASSAHHIVGLKSDGTVIADGENGLGQCNVENWRDIVAVTCSCGILVQKDGKLVLGSASHTVGLKTNGTVVATGANKVGQCNVNGWRNIIAMACGGAHTVGLQSDGTVVATGKNDADQCNVDDWQDIVAVSCGCLHTVGLKLDGTVVAVGNNSAGQCNVEDWQDIVAIHCGFSSTVGLKRDGTVVAVGNNGDGQCNTENWKLFNSIDTLEQEQTQARAELEQQYALALPKKRKQAALVSDVIQSYVSDTIGLKSDGTVLRAGNSEYTKYVSDVSGWHDIVAISGWTFHTVGLKENGTVIATGSNSNGECNVSGWRNIAAVYVMPEQTIGLKSDGTVVAAGKSDTGSLNISGWRNIKKIVINAWYTFGLKSDGTVMVAGASKFGTVNVSEWRGIESICHGGGGIFGIKSDGTVLVAGPNALPDKYGQCNVENWRNIVAIDCGNNYTVGLRSDGSVVAVGKNDFGQCNVENWKNIAAVACGSEYTVGVKSDGYVVATGKNDCGQCNVSSWYNIIAVFCSCDCTFGLKADGTVVATGNNDNGQCDVKKWKLFNNIDTLEQERENKRRQKLTALHNEKAKLQSELANLSGLFSGMRRKQIENRLAEINQELNRR